MIRDIRPLQSADQNRLREEHKREAGTGTFARFMNAANEDNDGDNFPSPQKRPDISGPSLLKENLWSEFFVRLSENNANDSAVEGDLFHWGEARENARRHTEAARSSANLSGSTPLHILNEKI